MARAIRAGLPERTGGRTACFHLYPGERRAINGYNAIDARDFLCGRDQDFCQQNQEDIPEFAISHT